MTGREIEEVVVELGRGGGRPHNFVWRLRAEELFDAIRQQIKGRLGKIFLTQMELLE